jgi:regulatory protein
MIDDEAFARAWVTSRHHSKGLAKRALAGELRRKGVADDDLGAALDELDGDTRSRRRGHWSSVGCGSSAPPPAGHRPRETGRPRAAKKTKRTKPPAPARTGNL